MLLIGNVRNLFLCCKLLDERYHEIKYSLNLNRKKNKKLPIVLTIITAGDHFLCLVLELLPICLSVDRAHGPIREGQSFRRGGAYSFRRG